MQCARSLNKNLDYSSWLARERFSATNKVINKISRKEARNIQSGTCEGSHLARSQSRPSDAALEPFCCLFTSVFNNEFCNKITKLRRNSNIGYR